MEEKIRKSGIDIIGNVPWGTHLCQFYHTKKDLIGILAPYFKAGLKNNEFCMWVTSAPLDVEDAEKALRKEVKNLDNYIKKGQIEILDYTEWYTKSGKFNMERVLDGWVEKEKEARKKGFDGLRLTGNTFWLEKKDWKDFFDYEAVVNSVIGKYKMLAICTYSLDKCGIHEILDVVANHQFALIERDGKWKIIESGEGKRAEEALRESEEFARRIIESSNDCIKVLDLDGHLLSMSKGGQKLMEIDDITHYLNRSWVDYWKGKDREAALEAISKAKKGDTEIFYGYCETAKGMPKWWEVIITPIKDSYGNIDRLLAVSRDITERKRAEEAVVAAKEYTDNIISSMIDTLVLIDPKGNIQTVNKATVDLLGYSEKELIGQPVGMIFAEEEEEEEEEEEVPFKGARLKKLIKEGSLRNYDVTYKTKRGERIPVSLNGSVMREIECSHGWPVEECQDFRKKGIHCEKIIGVIIIARDTAERKKAEEKIKLLSDAIETAIDGIVMTDLKGNITYANVAAEKMYGYDKGELIGKSTAVFNPDQNNNYRILSELKKNGNWHGEVLQQRKDKEIFMGLLALSVIKNEKGKAIGTMGAVRDITQIKKTEEELIRTERMSGIGQLAAGVAHEFNNLLNIIGGSAEYAKGVMDENEIKEALDIIMKSSDRGTDIVKSLLTFAGRVESKKELADIVEVIEETLSLVKRDLEKSGINVARGYSDVPKIAIDIGQIQQVFLNILLNAQRAMQKGGRLTVILKRENNFVKIQFHNTGRYINKKDLSKIFAPFFKLEGKRKEEPHRTGLGLSVSHGIIEAHGGAIEAESEKGKGATFTIRLPVIEKAPERAVLEIKPARKIKKGKTKVMQADILVIDDENNICNLFKKVLEKEGHIVSTSNSGSSALKLCNSNHYDLIYLDIVMPGIDGLDTFRKIKKIDPDVKIILITGKLIEDKIAQMYIDKGAIGFIRKPISNRELVRNTKAFLS